MSFLGRTERSIQQSFLFASFRTEWQGVRAQACLSSSPPVLELLFPASVCSALLSKPHLYKLGQPLTGGNKSPEGACSRCCDVSAPFRVKEGPSLYDQQTRLAVWAAVLAHVHKMSLFQCAPSCLFQVIFCI